MVKVYTFLLLPLSKVVSLSWSLARRSFLTKAAITTSVLVGGTAINKIFIVDGIGAPFTPEPSSLAGKTILITGGNTGLGAESAKRLALGGARVVITSRSLTKGQTTVKRIISETSNSDIHVLPLDLCDLESVRNFDKLWSEKFGNGKIDVLLNNAGVMAIPTLELTKDGYEKQFATNHLGHFLLTARLAKFFNKESRVINVSSTAHRIASKGLSPDIAKRESAYGAWTAYGESKLANILFTNELNRRNIVQSVSLHPGVVRTELARYIYEPSDANSSSLTSRALQVLFSAAFIPFTKDVQHGASNQVFLASFANLPTEPGMSTYYDNKKPTKPCDPANDESAAQALWDLSNELTKANF